ncbi:hypothetical protein SAY86_018171 [Trapa natans]|uniref:RBR-type E3 ubiquitin transferase n=1 Tax=Trapa natans TaxID=22666 RepID=A0AAN7LIN5_TRANT|nr:hypothetical protein SAY86_018171 [Trapa natans]
MTVPQRNPAPPQASPPTFHCLICMEENLPSSLLFTPTPMSGDGSDWGCRHCQSICRQCVASYIASSVQAGKSLVRCPVHGCRGWDFNPIVYRELVTREVFGRWCDLLCESALLGYERCYCPSQDCRELIVDECGGLIRAKKIRCPRCQRSFCFQCAEPWSGSGGGHRCERVEVVIGTAEWKRCPGCKNFVERDGGCRVIYCRCGTQFCYLCGKKIRVSSSSSGDHCSCNGNVRQFLSYLFLHGFLWLLICLIAWVLLNRQHK